MPPQSMSSMRSSASAASSLDSGLESWPKCISRSSNARRARMNRLIISEQAASCGPLRAHLARQSNTPGAIAQTADS